MPGVASGIIVLWPGTNSSIPTGWSRVTDLDQRFVKGTAASAPGVTGGSATHTHTSPSHTHTVGSHSHRGTTDLSGDTDAFGSSTGGAISDHTHTYASGYSQVSVLAAIATWQTSSNKPSFFEMIFVQSSGAPVGIPGGACVWYNSSSAPTGFTQHSGSEGRFVQGSVANRNGGGTGGGTHSHTANSHTHSISNHSHVPVISSRQATNTSGAGFEQPRRSGSHHVHNISFGSTATVRTSARTSAATGATSYEPEFHTLLCIENTSSSDRLELNVICMWLGTKASIPFGWVECDGSNGTPNLQGRFIRAAAVGGADVGNTGGSAGHDHTNPVGHNHTTAHTHSQTSDGPNIDGRTQSGSHSHVATDDHTHSGTTDSAGPTSGSTVQTVDSKTNTEPPFRTVAYLQLSLISPRGQAIFLS